MARTGSSHSAQVNTEIQIPSHSLPGQYLHTKRLGGSERFRRLWSLKGDLGSIFRKVEEFSHK